MKGFDNRQKNNKPGRYPVADFMRSISDSMPPGINYVFFRADGKPNTDKNLNKIRHGACSRVGI